jgi:hypothetical protein
LRRRDPALANAFKGGQFVPLALLFKTEGEVPANKKVAKAGGKISRCTRVGLVSKTGRKTVTGENYLPPGKSGKALKP